MSKNEIYEKIRDIEMSDENKTEVAKILTDYMDEVSASSKHKTKLTVVSIGLVISLVANLALGALALGIFSSDKDNIIADTDNNTTAVTNAQTTDNDGGVIEFEIDLSNRRITDEELAEMVDSGEIPANVKILNLDKNEISDISPLSGLTNLEELNLSNNSINDLTPLNGLLNLKKLSLILSGTDISSLSELTNLTDLYLGHHQISDLTPLSKLTNLTNLEVVGFSFSSEVRGGENNVVSAIDDLSPLSGLTKLKHLSLIHIVISGDLAPLSELINLETLHLEYNKHYEFSDDEDNDAYYGLLKPLDISPLKGLANLKELSITFNAIDDVTLLSEFINLTKLVLDSDTISEEQTDELKKSLPNTDIQRHDSIFYD